MLSFILFLSDFSFCLFCSRFFSRRSASRCSSLSHLIEFVRFLFDSDLMDFSQSIVAASASYRDGVDFRKNVRVNVLKYVFVLRQILLKHSKIFFSLIDKSTNYLEHTRMTNISTVEITKIFFFADMSTKFWRNALSPEHIDHLMLCFICKLSAQRKSIQVFNEQHIDI